MKELLDFEVKKRLGTKFCCDKFLFASQWLLAVLKKGFLGTTYMHGVFFSSFKSLTT